MGVKAKPELSGFSFLIHDEETQPDFSGWATKANLKCSDGRVIMPDAFKHQDKEVVPLVWQHGHNEPSNVLGYATLEHRDDGVYAYAFFNETDAAKNAKVLVQHGDIKSLSIYANQLTEKAKQVFHGFIRELSLVLSGANPGALIDNITLSHSDGELVTLDDEAIIYTGLEIEHAVASSTPTTDSTTTTTNSTVATDGPTVQDVYDSMTEIQQEVVHYMIGAALESATTSPAPAAHSDIDPDDEEIDEELDPESDQVLTHHNDDKSEEGRRMTRNVFEQQNQDKPDEKHVLTHDAIRGIVEDAHRGGSLKEAVEAYALKHGIENIDVLFPDARSITDTPEFDSRRVEWVAGVLNGTKHSPFSRIKSLVADLTFEEARAKGYVKGSLKKEEWFGVSKRTTTPSTIYKKQKLDRDDIIDITDFDVVMWLKAEMRLMLDEELARAILIGDGRAVDNEDKIKDPQGAVDGAGIRSILHDHDLYAATITVDDTATAPQMVDAIVQNMGFYKGSGSPTFYTTLLQLSSFLVTRDSQGRRLWKTNQELASELGVDSIVVVEVMEGEPDLVGIIVNLKDYTIGADKGGDISFFDDFDIDYNQYKYLIETRVSGSLTKIRSALVIKKASSTQTLVAPVAPGFTGGDTVTVPTTAGVTYVNKLTRATLITGTPEVLAPGESLTVEAVPADGTYYFADNQNDEWTFTNES